MTYEDLSSIVGDNPQGTNEQIYIAPVSDIKTFAEIPETPATLAESVTISGTHVMESGKKFYKVPVLELAKNNAASEETGAVSGSEPKQVFNGFIAGLKPTIEGFLKKAKGERHIVLIPLPDGQVLQLGTSKRGAQVNSNYDTTVAGGDGRGNAIVISAYHNTQFYTGDIPTTPAV